MKPIFQLEIGQQVRNQRALSNAIIKNWIYHRDCDPIGGGIMPGTSFEIVGKSPLDGPQWVRLAIPGRSPPGTLKVAGEELGRQFDLVET